MGILCTGRNYNELFSTERKLVDGRVGKVWRRVPLLCLRRRLVYLRPVRGCIKVGCVLAALAGCCLGLLTLVLLLANSSRIVWGMSGSNLTPCCKIAHKKSDCDFKMQSCIRVTLHIREIARFMKIVKFYNELNYN